MASMSPVLLQHLVDDAAVFPPGNAPLAEAVRRHRLHRTSRYAACVGPLLVPVADAAEVARLAAGGSAPLRLGLVARPGVPLADVARAVAVLGDSTDVEVAGVEHGWSPGWRDVHLGSVTRTVEVPRGDALEEAVADIAGAASGGTGSAPQAKFRTGATDTWAWPDEQELAAFLVTAAEVDVSFKLTGGLHHAARTTLAPDDAGAELQPEHHGLLNVLLAVQVARQRASASAVADVLADRDRRRLVHRAAALTDEEARGVRQLFTAYGCCEVTDPIGELTALHLLEES